MPKIVRVLIAVILAAVLGWSGWWWFAAQARQRAIAGWLEERREAGWVAEASAISVAGFPGRFDLGLEGLALADPDAGWAWDAPSLQILSLAYRPGHVIVIWPERQRLSVPGETATLAVERMRGSVVFVPGSALEPERAVIEIYAPAATGSGGWTASAARMRIATRRLADDTAPGHAQELFVEAESVLLPEPLRRRIDPLGALGEAVPLMRLDVALGFDAPWDRHAVEGRKPALIALSLRDLAAEWGELRLEARGRLHAGPDGLALGRIDLVARGWREMLRRAVAAGVIQPWLADALEAGLGVAAFMSGDAGTLRVPLVFEDGSMMLGPVPIGPAPRLQ
ncbi:MAG: hypothetical protein KatS3mg118_0527 [Paracoccaceae bacterium]|nr:MAG: hypothetical protein KatS3mg118_0527 [Paracoccaceae bacterium]